MAQTDEHGGPSAARRPMPLGHARILIGVVLFAALAGLAVALLPGTQEEPTSAPGPRVEEVESALQGALGDDAGAVRVAVNERTVVLQGAVPSEDLRRRAVQSVLALDAVVEVDDELTISLR